MRADLDAVAEVFYFRSQTLELSGSVPVLAGGLSCIVRKCFSIVIDRFRLFGQRLLSGRSK